MALLVGLHQAYPSGHPTRFLPPARHESRVGVHFIPPRLAARITTTTSKSEADHAGFDDPGTCRHRPRRSVGGLPRTDGRSAPANGKVITVDDRFSIAQALAVKGERIVAVGSTAEIERLRGAQTRVIDLNQRTVIPGLIDNHAHYMRAAEYWDREVRLDGINTHKEAMELIVQKARDSKPGEWVLVLGGWSEEQFTDEKRGFTKAELDAMAPDNPVVIQLIYFRIYTNSAGLKALGINENTRRHAGRQDREGERPAFGRAQRRRRGGLDTRPSSARSPARR